MKPFSCRIKIPVVLEANPDCTTMSLVSRRPKHCLAGPHAFNHLSHLQEIETCDQFVFVDDDSQSWLMLTNRQRFCCDSYPRIVRRSETLPWKHKIRDQKKSTAWFSGTIRGCCCRHTISNM
ncbi:Uncharacterised protein at_DN2590, partial [Pycnogonum litorale]